MFKKGDRVKINMIPDYVENENFGIIKDVYVDDLICSVIILKTKHIKYIHFNNLTNLENDINVLEKNNLIYQGKVDELLFNNYNVNFDNTFIFKSKGKGNALFIDLKTKDITFEGNGYVLLKENVIKENINKESYKNFIDSLLLRYFKIFEITGNINDYLDYKSFERNIKY